MANGILLLSMHIINVSFYYNVLLSMGSIFLVIRCYLFIVKSHCDLFLDKHLLTRRLSFLCKNKRTGYSDESR